MSTVYKCDNCGEVHESSEKFREIIILTPGETAFTVDAEDAISRMTIEIGPCCENADNISEAAEKLYNRLNNS